MSFGNLISKSNLTPFVLTFFILFNTKELKAQHQHEMSNDSGMKSMASDSMMSMPKMSHSYSLNLPMNMDGSGTAWLPANSPMYGYMIHSGKWNFMVHGNISTGFNKQDLNNKGSRGDEQWDAPNWFMFMGQTRAGKKGLFHFNTMLSLDALLMGGEGYPLLFQTGESYNGIPLVDRQHPHDLFSELSVAYSYAISKRSDIYVYVGYPGEPALGSVAFMHRPSSLSNPDAPLSHHWNDGTHVTFGVATLGFRYDKFKIEASSFTGREPDENRYNFDKPRFDSWSGRLSYAPSDNWSIQVSRGYVNSPEWQHPQENVNRTTASAIFSLPYKKERFINITGLWGINKIRDHESENAFLLEGDWDIKRFSLYGRYEWVQKSTEELNLEESVYGTSIFPINAVTLGFNYKIFKVLKTWVSLGGHIMFFNTDSKLDSLYGKNPMSAEVYIRIHPALMHMSH